MRTTQNLHNARKAKNDEFYTLYEDVEKEMIHYKDQLKGLVVYCPCDSRESNFVKYFIDHFDEYELKGLIATSLGGERLDYDGRNLKCTPILEGGDFRSEEVKKIAREESDIIITNPPFSLFRDFIKFLEEVG